MAVKSCGQGGESTAAVGHIGDGSIGRQANRMLTDKKTAPALIGLTSKHMPVLALTAQTDKQAVRRGAAGIGTESRYFPVAPFI